MSAAPPPALLGDVDTPRPLRAANGAVSLQGWCFIPGQPAAPVMRLAADAFTLPLTSRSPRTDIPRRHPGEAAARDSGFLIEGRVPAGIHLARLEAQLPDGRWQTLRTLCLAAEARPFAAGIDSPSAGQPVTQRVHVEGWALQPGAMIAALSLRYGHQEIACETGRARADVPAAYPDAPEAARAGFKSEIILSAGRGPLRLKARLADGSARIARTALEIAVATDENVGPEIDLAGNGSPCLAPASPPGPTRSPRKNAR